LPIFANAPLDLSASSSLSEALVNGLLVQLA
jgi:hypothetical protein